MGTMANHSSIEWTDATWNPVVGCTIVSPGCTNCYAMKMAARIIAMAGTSKTGLHYDKTIKDVKGKPVWTGVVNRAPDHIFTAPLHWRKPKRIFVNSMGDLFHEAIPDSDIDAAFAVMALCPQHTFQVLTKRAERMRDYLSRHDVGARWGMEVRGHMVSVAPATGVDWTHNGLPNVWLGVSCERQQEADERIPLLLQTPAAKRFVSLEPLLGPISLRTTKIDRPERGTIQGVNPLRGFSAPDAFVPRIDWVIVGGESGKKARPMHPEWARSLRDQCKAAGVAFFFKQWGEFGPCELYPPGTTKLSVLTQAGRHLDGEAAVTGAPEDDRAEIIGRFGKKAAGRLLDGVEHNEFPTPDGPTVIHERTPEHSVLLNQN